MMRWIILTIMTAAAVLVAALFLRRRPARPHAAASIEVGDHRPAAIDREAGRIDGAQAATARAEINRRRLIAGCAVVAIGVVALYAAIDNPPFAPGRPGTAGIDDPVEQLAAATGQQAAAESRPGEAGRTPLPSVDEMIARLAERLKHSPNDPQGWNMLGWSYLRTDRFAEAAAAYAKAVELSPDAASTRSSWGEALVKAAGGVVTPEARAVFDQTLRLDPREPGARYYVGLAKAQAGDRRAALDAWLALIEDSDPQQAFVADVATQAAELAGELGVDVSARLRRPAAAAPEAAAAPPAPARPATGQLGTATDRGPTAAAVSNAESMAPADRMAMIRGMVEGLAGRLDRSPRDADGWIKLIRSRSVLGETDAARQALDRALKVFDDAPEERSRIEAAARQIGVAR
jgi:cytochrome c-type biogenesis protein CcmH